MLPSACNIYMFYVCWMCEWGLHCNLKYIYVYICIYIYIFLNLNSTERELVILQGLEDLDIQEDENAVFVCEISVEDVPGEWYKNGERIQPTSTIKIRQEGLQKPKQINKQKYFLGFNQKENLRIWKNIL